MEKIKQFISNFRYLTAFFIIVITLLSLSPFFSEGLPVTHDGQDHVVRIANFYRSLKEGNLVPRWGGNLNWGYGHPVLMFLYPFPSYLASLFFALGFSLVVSVKLVFALSFVLSGLFMYFWLKEHWGISAGLAGALVYLYAPYRFVDLYVRGAIGECWAFVWPPLIAYFALKLSRGFRWSYLVGGSLSLAMMILSHNALSLMFLPFILGYLVFLISVSKKRSLLIHYSLFLMLGFGLSAFFWLPAFFEGKYTLRDIVTKNNISGFEPFPRLFWSKWNFGGTGSLSVQVGVLQWLGILLAPSLILRLKMKNDPFYRFLLFSLVYFFGAIFLILPLARSLYLSFPLLQKFQFAWRFLSAALVVPPVIWAALINQVSGKSKRSLLLTVALAALILNFPYWRAKDYLIKSEDFYQGVYAGTTDTGESAPRWSVRFMEEFPEAPLEIIDGQAELTIVKRKTNRHEYQVKVFEASRLVENTLYFPGWQVLVDGEPVEVEFQDPAFRGLMTFFVEPGQHEIKVIFTETKLRKAANALSLFSLFGLGLVWLGGKINKTGK